MSKPTGYVVRPRDMKALLDALGLRGDQGAVYDAARTLIGWAEPQQTQLPLVSVAPLALPPEADALVMRAYVDADTAQAERLRGELDRIADLWKSHARDVDVLHDIGKILDETGRLV